LHNVEMALKYNQLIWSPLHSWQSETLIYFLVKVKFSAISLSFPSFLYNPNVISLAVGYETSEKTGLAIQGSWYIVELWHLNKFQEIMETVFSSLDTFILSWFFFITLTSKVDVST
jgi:hypothetical protein